MSRFSSIVSKLNCFNHHPRNPDKHFPMPQDEFEEFRSRGQEILKSMLIQSERQESSVNWAAAIQDFEVENQERTRHQLWHFKRALERRKRFDNAGSFSINMLTYKTVDATIPAKPSSPSGSSRRTSNCSNADDRSSASTKSNATIYVIGEDIEY
jgi:hypothetical protein